MDKKIEHNEKKYFAEEPEIFNFFLNRKEKDFFIHLIGYHNFHVIQPEIFMRKQPCYTLHFVVSGHGYLVIGDKKYRISPYEIFYIDNNELFSYYPDADDPWEYIFFEFFGINAPEFAKEAGFSNETPIQPCNHPQRIMSLVSNYFKKSNSKKNMSYFEALDIFFAILASINTSNSAGNENNEEQFVDEIKHFIYIKFLNTNFSLSSVCQFANISHSHLCRIFKKHEGISVIEFITNLKINYAKELLANTKYNVYAISKMSGYQTYEYFLRLFKQKTGLSPTEFRTNAVNNEKQITSFNV